jgi:hypothetical protein
MNDFAAGGLITAEKDSKQVFLLKQRGSEGENEKIMVGSFIDGRFYPVCPCGGFQTD